MNDQRKSLDVLRLVWVDSEAANEWTPVEYLSDQLVEIVSVGLLVFENDEHFALAVSFDPIGEAANGIMLIPKVSVREVELLCTITTT